ncbi:MAG: beta-sandwich domain-containing protein [Fidelibacterota bacterium]
MNIPSTLNRFFLLLAIMSGTVWAGDIRGTVSAKIEKYQKDAVVYLDRMEGRTFEAPGEPVHMDQRRMAFVPRVLPVLVGTRVDFLNSDDVLHNVFSPDKVAGRFNLGTYPQGEVRSKVFEIPGSAVILCNVHPEMEAYVVVVETPYFAVTDTDGSFVIHDVPGGTYTLKVWSERYEGEPREVEVPPSGSVEALFHLEN